MKSSTMQNPERKHDYAFKSRVCVKQNKQLQDTGGRSFEHTAVCIDQFYLWNSEENAEFIIARNKFSIIQMSRCNRIILWSIFEQVPLKQYCFFRVLIWATHTDHIFSNKDHSVAGMWATNSIALGGMEFYWDVFLASFALSLFFVVFTFFSVRTVVLFTMAVRRRRSQEYQSKLNVAHLLGVTVTLKQIHQRKNEIMRNCDVCSICLVMRIALATTIVCYFWFYSRPHAFFSCKH